MKCKTCLNAMHTDLKASQSFVHGVTNFLRLASNFHQLKMKMAAVYTVNP